MFAARISPGTGPPCLAPAITGHFDRSGGRPLPRPVPRDAPPRSGEISQPVLRRATRLTFTLAVAAPQTSSLFAGSNVTSLAHSIPLLSLGSSRDLSSRNPRLFAGASRPRPAWAGSPRLSNRRSFSAQIRPSGLLIRLFDVKFVLRTCPQGPRIESPASFDASANQLAVRLRMKKNLQGAAIVLAGLFLWIAPPVTANAASAIPAAARPAAAPKKPKKPKPGKRGKNKRPLARRSNHK